MPAQIPPAELGATYTNEITGVTYTYDGMKWVAEGATSGNHEHDTYVKKEGDTVTGTLKMVGGLPFKIHDTEDEQLFRLGTVASSNMAQMVVKTGKAFKLGTESGQNFKIYDDGECRLSNLRSDPGEKEAVPRQWVEDYADDKLGDYYTKAEVDKYVKDEIAANKTPPGTPYIYRHLRKRTLLLPGEFTTDDDKDAYASCIDNNNRKIGIAKDDKQTITTILKVYDTTGRIVKFSRHDVIWHGQHGIQNLMWASSSDIFNELSADDDGSLFYLADGLLLPH